MNAGQGNDVITDGAGNDTSTGGLGADRFVYAPGNDADVVTDFGVGVDKLDFSAFTSIHSLADLLALTTQVGADTRIDFGSGDSVTLLNVARSALSAGDFTFAAAPPPPPPPDDNHAPVNGFHDATTAENKMAVASTASTDADHDALTYKISGGADAAFFVIDPNTHALSFKAGQDFESPDSSTHSNKYHLTVQVSDGEDTVGRDITVSVGNVNGETVKGNHGNNRIDSIHTVRGQHLPGGEEDTISGKHGNDRISGLGGNDHLTGGSGNDRLSGNDGIDALKGGKGADRLAGGLGNDLLNGGQGKDSFVFNTALANNVDTIKHFNAHDDKILLQDAVFTGLSGSGKLGSGEFHAGAAAHDANDHIIYNAKTGALLYDADGTGGIAAVRFAQISGHHSLDHSDFLVI